MIASVSLRRPGLALGQARASILATVEHAAGRIALAALGVAVAAVIATIVVWAGQHFEAPPVSFMTGPLPLAAQLPMAIAYASVGALLVSRRPRNVIGWMFLVVGLVSSLVPPVDLLAAAATRSFVTPPWTTLFFAWLTSSFQLPLIGASLIVVFLRFADGHVHRGRLAIAGRLAPISALAVSAGLAIDPDGLLWFPTLPDLFGG